MAGSGRGLEEELEEERKPDRLGDVETLEADVDELEGPIVARLYVPDLASLAGWATHEIRRPPAPRDRRLGFRR